MGHGVVLKRVCLGVDIVMALCCFVSYILSLVVTWMLAVLKVHLFPQFPPSGLTNELKPYAISTYLRHSGAFIQQYSFTQLSEHLFCAKHHDRDQIGEIVLTLSSLKSTTEPR